MSDIARRFISFFTPSQQRNKRTTSITKENRCKYGVYRQPRTRFLLLIITGVMTAFIIANQCVKYFVKNLQINCSLTCDAIRNSHTNIVRLLIIDISQNKVIHYVGAIKKGGLLI
jgi:hypothetical protein